MKDVLSNWIHRLTYVTPFIQVERLLLWVCPFESNDGLHYKQVSIYKKIAGSAAIINHQPHSLCPMNSNKRLIVWFLGKKACVLKARINPRPHRLWNLGGDASWEAKPGFYTNFEKKVEHHTSQTLNVLATQIWVYLIYFFFMIMMFVVFPTSVA